MRSGKLNHVPMKFFPKDLVPSRSRQERATRMLHVIDMDRKGGFAHASSSLRQRLDSVARGSAEAVMCHVPCDQTSESPLCFGPGL